MLSFIYNKQNRHFMRLWWAQLISQLGDRIHQMALVGLIAQRDPGSAMGLAKLLSCTIIPVFLIGPLAGVYVDRWDRRQTLFVCDLLRGAMVLTIPLIFIYSESMVPIYLVVFLIFCCSRFYIPAKMAIIPDLVHKDNLLIANSLISTTGMIAFVVGAAAGGWIVETRGAAEGFIWDAVTFFVSALFIMTIRSLFGLKINKKQIIAKGREFIRMEKTVWGEIKEGLGYLSRHREIHLVMNMLFILLAAAGAIYVVIIVFIQESFQSVTKDLGVLAIALGVGLFLGAIGYGKWGQRLVWYKTIFLCLIGGGIMVAAFASLVQHYPNLMMASVLSFVLGMVIGPVFIIGNTVIQLVCEESMRGKVFSALEIVIHFAFLVSMLASSWLAKYVSQFVILLGVGGVFALVGIWGLLRFRGKEGVLAISGS
jgi:MFS family permease